MLLLRPLWTAIAVGVSNCNTCCAVSLLLADLVGVRAIFCGIILDGVRMWNTKHCTFQRLRVAAFLSWVNLVCHAYLCAFNVGVNINDSYFAKVRGVSC